MPNGKVTLNFGDGEYDFNIAKIGQVIELEEKCGCGVAEIFERLRTNRWHLNDARETLRLGLIGGGMEPAKANVVVRRYVDERPWREAISPAMAVLMVAMFGVPGDEPGKKPEAERTAAGEALSSELMAASSAPQSMDVPLRSDGARASPTR
jgi:hypothetical protein